MQKIDNNQAAQLGFTLVELLIVIVIVAVLFVLSSVNLGHAQTTASLTSTTNSLLADLRNQQILAMSGEIGSSSTQQPHGIYVQTSDYVLFADSSFSSGDPNNFTVNTNPAMLSTTFPSDQVLFNTGDGSVANFTNGDNTITITDGSNSQTITINRFGATTVN